MQNILLWNKISKYYKYITENVEDIIYPLIIILSLYIICSVSVNLINLTYLSRTISSRKLSLIFAFPERTGGFFFQTTMVPYTYFCVCTYLLIFNCVFMCLFLYQLGSEQCRLLLHTSFKILGLFCPISFMNTIYYFMNSVQSPKTAPWSLTPGVMSMIKLHYMEKVMDLTHLRRVHYEAKVEKFYRCN